MGRKFAHDGVTFVWDKVTRKCGERGGGGGLGEELRNCQGPQGVSDSLGPGQIGDEGKGGAEGDRGGGESGLSVWAEKGRDGQEGVGELGIGEGVTWDGVWEVWEGEEAALGGVEEGFSGGLER